MDEDNYGSGLASSRLRCELLTRGLACDMSKVMVGDYGQRERTYLR